MSSDLVEVVEFLVWIRDLLNEEPPFIRYGELVKPLGYQNASSVSRLLNGTSPPPGEPQLRRLLQYVAERRAKNRPEIQAHLQEKWMKTASVLCRKANDAVERRRTLLRKSARHLADELMREQAKVADLEKRLGAVRQVIENIYADRLALEGPATSSLALDDETTRVRRREERLAEALSAAQDRIHRLEDELDGLRGQYRAVTVETAATTGPAVTDRSPVNWLAGLPPLRPDLPEAQYDLLAEFRALLQGAGVHQDYLAAGANMAPETVEAVLSGARPLTWAEIERLSVAAGIGDTASLRPLHRAAAPHNIPRQRAGDDTQIGRDLAARDAEIRRLRADRDRLAAERDEALAAVPPTFQLPPAYAEDGHRGGLPHHEPPLGITLSSVRTAEYQDVHATWDTVKDVFAANRAVSAALGRPCDLDEPAEITVLSAHVAAEDGELIAALLFLYEVRHWCTYVMTATDGGDIRYLVPTKELAKLFAEMCGDVLRLIRHAGLRPARPERRMVRSVNADAFLYPHLHWRVRRQLTTLLHRETAAG